MRKYGESKMTRIMMATVPHVTSGLGLRKFQADGFLLTRVYKCSRCIHLDIGDLSNHIILVCFTGAVSVKAQCIVSSTEWTSIKFDCSPHRLHVTGVILVIIAVSLNVYLPSSVLAPTWTVYLHRICHVFTFKMPNVYFSESLLKVAWFMCCYVVTMKCCVILT